MAGKIKGITIVFEGETTKLDAALKKIGKESKDVDAQLKDINRLLRFNPRNVELMRQKFALLGQKIDVTENQLKELRNVEKQMKAQGVSKQSEEWMKVRRKIIEAESKLKHFKAEANKLKFARISAMGQAFKTAGQNMRQAGMYASMAAGGMIIAGKKLLDLNATQADAERKLIEIYKTRMGVDEERAKQTMKVASALQKEGVIGDEVALSGAQQLATYAKMPKTIDTLLPAMENLLVQQKGYNASAEDAQQIANLFGKAMMGQTGALKKVGISFSEEQEKILKFGTEEEKAAMLSKVITENVGNMNQAFLETDEGKMAQLKNTLGDIGERLGAVLLPALGQMATFISESIMPKVEQLMAFIEAHPVIGKIAVGLTALLAVMGPLLIIIGALISAVGTIMTALGSLSGVFASLSGPIGVAILVIGLLIAAGIALYKNWDKIKAKAAELAANISAKFNALKTKVKTIFTAIANAMLAPIKNAVNLIKAMIDKIKNFFQFKVNLPHMKLPHFKISPAGWKLSDLLKGKIPKLGIDWYAQGGIFDSPSVIGVGEAGSEAVVPLDKLWKQMAQMQGGDNITINVVAPEGASVQAIAKEVERRLIEAQKRRRLAWQ